jgi:hypothetical protein
MTYESDCDRWQEAQEVASGFFDTQREDVAKRFWNGELAGEFAEWTDASDLAWLAILLIRTPWEDLQDVISAQASNEYRSVEQAIDEFIDAQTRTMLGWD